MKTEAKKSGIYGQGQGQRSGKLEDKAELKTSVSWNKPKVGNQEDKTEMERGNWFWIAKVGKAKQEEQGKGRDNSGAVMMLYYLSLC